MFFLTVLFLFFYHEAPKIDRFCGPRAGKSRGVGRARRGEGEKRATSTHATATRCIVIFFGRPRPRSECALVFAFRPSFTRNKSPRVIETLFMRSEPGRLGPRSERKRPRARGEVQCSGRTLVIFRRATTPLSLSSSTSLSCIDSGAIESSPTRTIFHLSNHPLQPTLNILRPSRDGERPRRSPELAPRPRKGA